MWDYKRGDKLYWRETEKHVFSITREDGLNIFYSGVKYTENDLVRLKVRHYSLQQNEIKVY